MTIEQLKTAVDTFVPPLTQSVIDNLKALANGLVPDPVSVVVTDQPIITDAPGGLTSAFVYGGNTATGAPIAPWLRWIGQDNSKTLCNVSLAVGFVGKATLPLGAFPGAIQVGLFFSGIVTVDAKPLLTVTYADGTTDTIAPAAEVGSDTSTFYMLVGHLSWNLAKTVSLWLRYQPTKAVQSASIALNVTKVWDNGSVTATPFMAGYLAQPTLAPLPTGETLFNTECWEDGPPYVKDHLILPAYDLYGQRKFVDCIGKDGKPGRALELWYDPRQSNLLDQKIGIYPEATECVMAYDLMVMTGAGAATVENGKLPGFSPATKPDDAYQVSYYKLPFPVGTIGTLGAGNGGSMVHGNDGWSDRGDWLAPRKPPHPLAGRWPLSSYVYNPDFIDYNGQQFAWGDYGTGTLTEGQWYRIEHRLKVNSVPATGKGNNDGELESRIDGKLALLYKTLRLRDAGPYTLTTLYGVATELKIRSFWLCAYHGGRAFPTARVPAFRMRNFNVQKIG